MHDVDVVTDAADTMHVHVDGLSTLTGWCLAAKYARTTCGCTAQLWKAVDGPDGRRDGVCSRAKRPRLGSKHKENIEVQRDVTAGNGHYIRSPLLVCKGHT